MVKGETLDLHCIPQTERYPPRTLLVGAPGVGKSSITIELCKRWYSNHLLHEYEYVILLQAHDPKVSTAKSIDDVVPNENQDWLSPIKKENGRNTLFIIDGYDQLSEESRQQNSFYDRFICGEILTEAAIIVTTRPWCVKSISKYFSNEVEILGFTPQGRKDYIEYFLEGDADDFLLQTTAMERCLNIPFYLATLVEVFTEYKQDKSKASFPNTLTKLYGALIRTLVLRFVWSHDNLSKFLEPSFDIPPGEFSCFPRHVYQPFLELCALSYKSLSNPPDSLVPNPGSVTFNLLTEHTIETTSGRSSYYRFLHSSVREYLAAYCISRMEMADRNTCIDSLKQSKQFHLIIEFLYGFGCMSLSIDQAGSCINNLSILRQLCEADSPDLIKSVYQNVASNEPCIVKRTHPWPTIADFWCLGRVIALSNRDWELGFTLRPIGNDHLKMLCKGIESVGQPDGEETAGKIKKIGLSLTKIDEKGLEHLFNINERCLSNVEEIYLSGNHLTSSVIPVLCNSLPKLQSLKAFLFHHNEIQLGSHRVLIMTLANCLSLEHVSFTDLLLEECQMIVQTLKRLKIIELWRISTESCQALFDAIPDSNIEELQVYQSEINPACIKNLPATLPRSRVKHLKLINCGIECKSVEVIANAANQLESIDLSDNAIRDKGGSLLLRLHSGVNLSDTYKFNDFSSQIYEELKARGHQGRGNSEQTTTVNDAQQYRRRGNNAYRRGRGGRGWSGQGTSDSGERYRDSTRGPRQKY